MNLHPLLAEKVLQSLHIQMIALVADADIDLWERFGHLASIGVPPWEIPAIFSDYGREEATKLIDQYRLKAVYFCHPNQLADPSDQNWQEDSPSEVSVPLFSPLDVWKAAERYRSGDPGILPPPIACDADKLLRSVQRGFSRAESRVADLADSAHDHYVLAAALSVDDPQNASRVISDLAAEHNIWQARDVLSNGAGEEYRQAYRLTIVGWLRQVLNTELNDFGSLRSEWISPAIIPLIEECPFFAKALKQPSWLLYKAVVILKGHLPEEDHNRMVAEALIPEPFAKAYCDFLKTLPAQRDTTTGSS